MVFDDLIASYDSHRHNRNVFHDLMRFRVREVLLVASLYDSFVIEADGVLAEQIYGEYFKLNLSTLPRITCAYTERSALSYVLDGQFDLVVLVAGLDFEVPLKIATNIKQHNPKLPILLLATNNYSLSILYQKFHRLDAIDRIYVWNGYSKLFVGMIKLIEDLHNADDDTRTGLVRVILLIEDSVRYYSRYLPLLFQVVSRQTQSLIEEEFGIETNKLLRSRSRPKVLLASNYEEAVAYFNRYESYMLTVITDISFSKNGRLDPEAGFDFLRMVKERIPDLTLMVQSSDAGIKENALAFEAAFANKNSDSLEHELAVFFQENLGFGTFTFTMPNGKFVATAKNMTEFMQVVATVPRESLLYHTNKNHFSRWLMARGEIHFANLLKPYHINDFSSDEEFRSFLMRILEQSRQLNLRGTTPDYSPEVQKNKSSLTRLANGSVGGKGRGIVFIHSLLENLDVEKQIPEMSILLPRTCFIGIDEFEKFLEVNDIWSYAYYEAAHPSVEAGLNERFLSLPLSQSLLAKLNLFVLHTHYPIAIRSSGLFEDMLMVPFAGIYDTYILPNNNPDPTIRLQHIIDAIRLIYASLFSTKTRKYFEMAGYALEEERMAVIIQELAGTKNGRFFYPHISGTAQSYNYYPISYLLPEDGLCVAAIGLGSYVVGGGESFRFCPKYPKLDLISSDKIKEASQKYCKVLDMESSKAMIRNLDLSFAEEHYGFSYLVSTWDQENDRLIPGIGIPGTRIVDFANILKHEALPFAQAIELILEIGSKSLGTPIEIEYSLCLGKENKKPELYILQIKPLIRSEGHGTIDISNVKKEDCFVYSVRAMGNGQDTIKDIVWVNPKLFNIQLTSSIPSQIELLDRELTKVGRKYILIGPGRWGTRDPFLGIPVIFAQISKARVIIETEYACLQVESSQGSHFFHNVTSMNIGYISVTKNSESLIDWDWLYSQPVKMKTEHCVWTSVEVCVEILMDGKSGRGGFTKKDKAS